MSEHSERLDTPLTIGLLGGMSSTSTVEYYRGIDEGVNRALGGHHAGDLLIRSVNFADIEAFIHTEQWEEAGAYLADAARDLVAGGADFVVMATNTMHRVAAQISDAIPVPFVHIVDPTADAVLDAGLDTVGVLGTAVTMAEPFYRERFAAQGVDIVVPEAQHHEEIDRVIFGELTRGEVRDDSRAYYLDRIDDLADAGAEGVVLGCTEIELLVDQSDRPETPLFDTTALHVERAVEYSLNGF